MQHEQGACTLSPPSVLMPLISAEGDRVDGEREVLSYLLLLELILLLLLLLVIIDSNLVQLRPTPQALPLSLP